MEPDIVIKTATQVAEAQAREADFNRMAGTIHDLRRDFVRRHGLSPEWLLMTASTWAKLKSVLDYHMRYAALVEAKKPSEVFGLKVAIIDVYDHNFEFMEVR